MRFLLFLLAFLLPMPALAQSQVALTSEIFVERTTTDADGQRHVSLEAPGVVTPGDPLIFVLHYRNNAAAPATDFVVTNPIPESVSYAGAESAGSVLSVDGGRTWGELATLERAQCRRQQPAGGGRGRHAHPLADRSADPGRAARASSRFRGVVK